MASDDFVIEDIKLDGFQIIRGQYFKRESIPYMTLWDTSCQFSASAYTLLNCCENVQLLVNHEQRRIIVRPTNSNDDNAVSWLSASRTAKTTKLECSPFTRRIFETWDWNPQYRYRTSGRIVRSKNSLMLLFDFSNPVAWNGMKMVRDNG